MDQKELTSRIVTSLDKHKAMDITVLGVAEISPIADYFVIASGGSNTQVKSLDNYIEDELAECGVTVTRREGLETANWILMDFGSVVVHIFKTETRRFYDLERLWKDAVQYDSGDFIMSEGEQQ